MSLELASNNRIDFNFNSRTISFSLILTAFLLIPPLLIIGIYMEVGIYVLCGIATIFGVCFFIRYPRFWLYTLVLSTIFYFRESSEGLSAQDVILGIFYVAGLFIWLVWQILVVRRRLVQNIADWLLLFYFIFTLTNLSIAMINGVEWLEWFREYAVRILILYYFPFRVYIKEKKHIITLLVVFCTAVFITDITMLYDYYRYSYKIVAFAYQITYSPRKGEMLFTAATIGGLTFFFFQKKLIYKILLFTFFLISFIALASTFARAFWVVFIFEFIILFFYLNKTQKIKLLFYSFVAIAVLVGIIYNFFPDNASTAIKVVETRLLSSTKGTQDMSVYVRVLESEAILKKIAEYPLGGNGMQKKFSYYNPLVEFTTESNFCHNGYFFNIYRVGLPLFLFYLIPIIYYFVKSFLLLWKEKEPLYKAMLMCTFFWLLILFITNLVGHIFGSRETQFIVPLAFVMVSFIEQRSLKKTDQNI
jgi:hypothetical protein